MKKLYFLILFLIIGMVYLLDILDTFAQSSATHAEYSNYSLSWPGILPDNPLYKIKVLRNKVIEKIIINPVKKVEFDLLMSDKTIYAAQLLMEKGNTSLAKDTLLKGENYYSLLVQNYSKALLSGKKIPLELDDKITRAAQKHQELFTELEKKADKKDKEVFQIVTKFSKINYEFIKGLKSQKKKNE